MTAQDRAQHEMQRMLTKLIDGVASEQEIAALSEKLRVNPKLHKLFVDIMQSEAALDEIHSRDLLAPASGLDETEQLQPGEAIAGLGVLGNQTPSTKPKRNSAVDGARSQYVWWQRLKELPQRTPLWAIAATVLMTLCGYLFWPSAHMALVATENVQWRHGTHYEIGQRIGGEWIDIEAGVIQLAFDSSAAMKIEGPARIRSTGNRNCELQLGSALIYAPAAAKGFTVDTPEMRVVDLGTSFRVEVSESKDTSLQVLEGIVEAQAKASGRTHRLVDGEVAAVEAGSQQGLQLTAAERLYPKTSNRIAFRAKHAPSLGQNGFKGNDRCYVFLERYNFVLPHELSVNLTASGKHRQFSESSGELQAGMRVDCFLVHSAPRAKRHSVDGTVTFYGEILGVITSSDKLNATNDLFGSPWSLRCQHPERGLESTPSKNSDRLEISPDRRTLRLTMRTESIDQVRVLVASPTLEKIE